MAKCFCSEEQLAKAYQSMKFPVLFYLDLAIEKDRLVRLTLSYTFLQAAEY